MNGELANPKVSEFSIPEDAVFERAPILPHDQVIKPTHSDALHLDGFSERGDVVEYLHFDDVEGKFHHEMRQDIEPTLNYVKDRISNEGANAGKSKSGEWYHAARVDQVVVLAWLNKLGLTMCDFRGEVLKRFLNDSDNAAFRIYKGRV